MQTQAAATFSSLSTMRTTGRATLDGAAAIELQGAGYVTHAPGKPGFWMLTPAGVAWLRTQV